MEDAVHLQQLLASLQQHEKQEQAVQEAVRFVQHQRSRDERASSSHRRLCAAALQAGIRSRALLQALGPAEALSVVHSSVNEAPLQSARWLCSEVQDMLSRDELCQVLFNECRRDPAHSLTSQQEQLVGVVCRLPDLLANKMGRQLHPSLLPRGYFAALGRSMVACLERVHTALRASEDCSLVFPAAVVGKAALLGHKDAVLSQLVPLLELRAGTDLLWKRVSQMLFARVPSSCLEPVLDAAVHYATPSLLPSGPLHLLLGELALTSQRAGFLLAHKMVLVKVPPSPHAAFTLVGYLASTEGLRCRLAQALQAALAVWADASVLRHMDTRQHQWLGQVLVLGVRCLSDSDLATLRPALQQLVMAGLQTHMDSPLPAVRETGMTVGESLMNRLNPTLSEEQKLRFEYSSSEDIQALLRLARPVEEQEKELRAVCRTLREAGHPEVEGARQVPPDVQGVGHETARGRYGQGMAQATEGSDVDSDDDLEPYAMGEDPDSTQPRPPRYLRTLLQALRSSSEPLQQETALRAAESLIRSQPVDLSEVCQELAKVLLHLSDASGLPELPALRHKALVALAVSCPAPVAQYLTAEFYSPHYSLRQRTDILEVLSAAALELARPHGTRLAEVGVASLHPSTPSPFRPWEEEVRERLKAKTRIIARGPRHPPPPPTPSRFAPVAGQFFFPLLAGFEQATPTLDLLGRDCLLLGALLHTLGVLMQAATHAPIAPSMAVALLDFVWALRYHSSVCVQQGVLFALGMLLASAPAHSLLASMEGSLAETGHWLRDVCVDDADEQCRHLASHALSLLDSTVKESQSS